MARLATPGVYVIEKNAFTSSVVAVPTAVPAFIGYTEKAIRGKTDLTMKPTRVSSFPEFVDLFGGAPYAFNKDRAFSQIEIAPDPKNEFVLQKPSSLYYLFASMRMFYKNGGGDCYIVSVGNFEEAVDGEKIQEGVDRLLKEQEPTMVLSPDAVLLDKEDCHSVYQKMLLHCGNDTRSRIAILDVHEGTMDRREQDVITEFREGVGSNFLDFGVGYYPWLNTTIISPTELDYRNISNRDELVGMLINEAKAIFPDPPQTGAAAGKPFDRQGLVNKAHKIIDGLNDDNSNMNDIKKKLGRVNAEFGKVTGNNKDQLHGNVEKIADRLAKAAEAGADPTNPRFASAKEAIEKMNDDSADPVTVGATLMTISPLYKAIMKELRFNMNVLPPSGAMAGIYSMTDNIVGVHKAPANVSLSSVVSPTVVIGNNEQEDLNLPLNGKAVNVIRSFIGKGILVWGARTLDGNSQDWRYIGVRRTMIMIEQSIKNAIEAFVFEANNARTWIKVKTSIDNFLTTVWQSGALAGVSTTDAYETSVGLGVTMSPEDILDGVMRVTVKVAITRPAEFIVITFQQKMQES